MALGAFIALKHKELTEDEAEAFIEKNLKKFYPEVGRIVAVWGMLEWRMDQLIWDMMGVEQQLGACITSQLNGPTPRIRTIKALSALLGASGALLTKKINSEVVWWRRKKKETAPFTMLGL